MKKIINRVCKICTLIWICTYPIALGVIAITNGDFTKLGILLEQPRIAKNYMLIKMIFNIGLNLHICTAIPSAFTLIKTNLGEKNMHRGLTTKKENAREFNETWVEGDLIHSGDKVYIHPIHNKVSVQGELGKLIVMHEVQPDTVTELMTKKESKFIDYIMNNMHWCPFKDEADIDFDKECVGFRENGCKECIYRNIDKLN